MTPTNRLPAIEALGEAERVARAICKARGINPDTCVMGSSGLYEDGKYFSKCWRYAWQDQLHIAHAAIAALSPGPTVNAGEEVA